MSSRNDRAGATFIAARPAAARGRGRVSWPQVALRRERAPEECGRRLTSRGHRFTGQRESIRGDRAAAAEAYMRSKRMASGQHLVRDHCREPRRPTLATRGRLPPARAPCNRVCRRAGRRSCCGPARPAVRTERLGEPEVEHLGHDGGFVSLQKDVLWLQVAVHEPVRMRGAHGGTDPTKQVQHLARCQRCGLAIRCRNVCPSSSSITRNARPASSMPKSYTRTTCTWANPAAARASRRKRAVRSTDATRSSRITFTATGVRGPRHRRVYDPMPPRPSRRSSR